VTTRIKRWLAFSALAVLTIAGIAILLWQDMESSLQTPITLTSPEIFELEPGTSIAAVAERFAARGWIRCPEYLRLDARLHQQAARLQAGAYDIVSGDTPRQIIAKFVSGRVKVYQLTFAEGLRFDDILQLINQAPGLTLTLNGLPQAELMSRLDLTVASPEGYFFPSTYFYHHNTTDRELLQRSHRKMTEILSREWEHRPSGLPYASPEEALVMASIIERETARPDERPEISGVFVRRLEKGMKLQTDPTVIYGLGERFDGNLRRADLESDTPYNTYTRKGLPPTPICLPGEDAIRAAMHPAAGDALYFVSRGDGSHVFSATLVAHNAAVRQFQSGAASK